MKINDLVIIVLDNVINITGCSFLLRFCQPFS